MASNRREELSRLSRAFEVLAAELREARRQQPDWHDLRMEGRRWAVQGMKLVLAALRLDAFADVPGLADLRSRCGELVFNRAMERDCGDTFLFFVWVTSIVYWFQEQKPCEVPADFGAFNMTIGRGGLRGVAFGVVTEEQAFDSGMSEIPQADRRTVVRQRLADWAVMFDAFASWTRAEAGKIEDQHRSTNQANTQSARPEGRHCYISLRQAAAMVQRTKRSLETLKYEGRLPAPDVRGGTGKADEWLWSTIKPALEAAFNRKLPDEFPSAPGLE